MVMMAEPLARCLNHIRDQRGEALDTQAPLVFFSHRAQAQPCGGRGLVCQRWCHLAVWSLRRVDQRFIDAHVTVQLSLGDFLLSGGEIAALALLDAVARLQPGVLSDEGSHQFDSFNPALDGLLDCPHYTRPEEWAGRAVPAPLMSGHHAQIERWRRDQRLLITARHRPDLIDAARAAGVAANRRGGTRQIALTGYNGRLFDPLAGRFVRVSPRQNLNVNPDAAICGADKIVGYQHEPDPDPGSGRNRPLEQDHPLNSPLVTPSS